MHLSRRIWIQIAIFVVVSITAFTFMALDYMRLPSLLFGVGQYKVTLELPTAGGLYERSNVTFNGTEVGRVESVSLTNSGVAALLSLRSDIQIPSDLKAEVHSQSAVGEQYVALLPIAKSRPLKAGDVIPVDRTSIPPPIDTLVDAANRGLEAIPGDNLRTTIDEAYTAVGGLGPEISRFVKASTSLAIDARKNLDAITALTDESAPVLETQSDTAGSIQAWASHLATVTQQLRDNDTAVAGILHDGPQAAAEVRQLFDRVKPTLPVLLANLASIAPVLVTYRDGLEQLLVMVPQGVATSQGSTLANRDSKQDYAGQYLSFNLNLNLPPPCTTGFLPAQQRRSPTLVDAPERPDGDLYCRVPQDSPFNVRGARNLPCETRPGKRAPTVTMCESDENYVPLNDGFNWKGDPNATLSGQAIPQLPPIEAGQTALAPQVMTPPPIATATYDPATGQYVGPDGKVYTQSNLAGTTAGPTWQSMLLPPAGG
ncbi:MCE family protein [Mycobacterium sp. URHB0044]|jgi:phospholipid/cholesterol/gamma-HCH transport system substrate-binding protein|uniref:MCE family protein n=1 Tax=Mycobacterium sp. URHB0044 TaxID=1380386 RepID=UPI00048CC5FF|nr:MlaD family protein [Mycobacterium sp. URHB0044]